MNNNDDIHSTDTAEIKRIICESFKSEAEAEADGSPLLSLALKELGFAIVFEGRMPLP
jgi:hypothetical protein